MAQSGPSFGEFAEHILAVLDKAIGFDTGLSMPGNTGPGLVSLYMDDEQLHRARKGQDLALSRYALDVGRILTVSEQQGGCIDRDIYSSSELEKMLLYQEVLRPARICSMLHLSARWQGRPILRMSLARHSGQRFRPKDLERALMLLPTIEASQVSVEYSQKHKATQALSPRELEVARHVARGLTTPQIAKILGTSKFTVRNQLVSIFDKLKVASRSELAAFMAARDALSGVM